METGFQLFPDQASSVAPRVDALYIFLLCVTAFFTLAIFLAIVFLALYYRRSAKRDRSRSGPAGKVWLLETTWIVIPLALTMVMFVWGANVYFDMQTSPADAIELQVVAKQWMWKIQHPQGRSEINELHVPVGQPVRLRMISEDVIHSFYVPAFRVKMDVLPGRYTTLWFEATRPGRYNLFCAEYCGTNHAAMSGHVVALSPAEYAVWLAGATVEAPPAIGERLFAQFRCQQCHQAGSEMRSPPLEGLFGARVALADGRAVTADDAYLRESIVDPLAKITAGFQPLMPTYAGQLNEEQLFQLIDYLKSLSQNRLREGASPIFPRGLGKIGTVPDGSGISSKSLPGSPTQGGPP
ncbi:MAG: cytochrome c oxidase subunit II [Pirellulales bacterium]